MVAETGYNIHRTRPEMFVASSDLWTTTLDRSAVAVPDYTQSPLLADSLVCLVCGKRKAVEAFNKDKSRPSGRHPYCSDCVKAKRRKKVGPPPPPQTHCKRGHEFTPENTYVQKNGSRQCRACVNLLAKGRRDKRDDYRLRWQYGINLEDYMSLLDAQNGTCFICKSPPVNHKLMVDHDHDTGVVRGLLCAQCNHGIGNFQDNPELIRRAATYVEAPPAQAILRGEHRATPDRAAPQMPQLAVVPPHVPSRPIRKLTDDDIRAIRERVATGNYTTYTALAKEFGVCQRTVRDIAKGRVWQDIT